MKKLLQLSFILLMVVSFTGEMNAQSNIPEGTWGLRSTIGTQAAIEVPYQLNESLSIAPAVTFVGVQDNRTTFGLSVIPRYYMSNENNLATFFTGNLGVQNTSFEPTGSQTFFILGVGFGAEYFFSNKFSMSADANLNSNLGDDIANTLTTGARVSASVYFN